MRGALLGLLAALAMPGVATAQVAQSDPLAALMREDARLQALGYRLARANAPLCAATPVLGLLLLDAESFAAPARIRAALGLKGDIAVDAVADGSPAALAGLRAGDEVVAIAGAPIPPKAKGAPDYARLRDLHDRIDTALGARGSVELVLADGRTLTLNPVPACASRFELLTSGDRALADGARVLISRRALAQTPSEDAAAYLVAHELAHNVLRHKARLSRLGRTVGAIRDTEREADLLALWLMANAGYDPAAAAPFLRVVGPKGLLALIQEPTHDRFETRARKVEAELAVLRATLPGPDGLRDWRGRFLANPPQER